MKKQLNQVLEFHQLFQAFIADKPTDKIPVTVKQARVKLIREETEELIEAIETGSIKEIAHEIADVLYVVLGTVISFGLQHKMAKVFSAIHQSNLSKMSQKGTFEITLDKSKILKGKQYRYPNIEKILKT